jgi:hypothetical protein
MDESRTANDVVEAFWRNARDSLWHALDHLQELDSGSKRKWHHHKWLILSVDHAATCVGCMWLKEMEPDHDLFRKGRFPSFKQIVPVLSNHLSKAENGLIKICSDLNEVRDLLMHRPAPPEIDQNEVSLAAMAMIGIVRIVAHRKNMSFYKLFDEFPENRKAIFSAIHYRKHDQYMVMIESLLSEQEPAYMLDQCPACGTRSVIFRHCEACFEDLKSTTCYNIECRVFGTEFLYYKDDPNPECPECGAKV